MQLMITQTDKTETSVTQPMQNLEKPVNPTRDQRSHNQCGRCEPSNKPNLRSHQNTNSQDLKKKNLNAKSTRTNIPHLQ